MTAINDFYQPQRDELKNNTDRTTTISAIIRAAAAAGGGGSDVVDDACRDHHYTPGRQHTAGLYHHRDQRSTASQHAALAHQS